MIDLRRLQDDADYRAGAVKKGADESLVAEVVEADSARRAAMADAEQARAAANAASKEIGRAAPWAGRRPQWSDPKDLDRGQGG